MAEISFKERVKNVLIDEAKNYRDIYINYEYLLYADAFSEKYYIITGTKENYLHLSGVHTALSSNDFYEKCINGTLEKAGFEFSDKSGKDMKGTVRRKVKVLNNFTMLMLQKNIYVQEGFCKNNVVCTLGASDYTCTVGFIKSGKNRDSRVFPKTLLKGNELKNPRKAEILLRKKKDGTKFDEILIGGKEEIKQCYREIGEYLAPQLCSGE